MGLGVVQANGGSSKHSEEDTSDLPASPSPPPPSYLTRRLPQDDDAEDSDEDAGGYSAKALAGMKARHSLRALSTRLALPASMSQRPLLTAPAEF